MTEDKPRGVPISPKAMVDSLADWPLHRVVEYLRGKEKDDKSIADADCRMYYTSGIRMFSTIVDELAESYGVPSKGRMSRYLSYHGVEIARQDKVLSDLQVLFSQIRKSALGQDSQPITDIQENTVSYSPKEVDGKRISFYVYSTWVLSEFNKLAQLCGVAPAQVAQVYMTRSILTCDLVSLSGVAKRLKAESDWWDRWMKYRLGVLELSVSLWDEK